MAGSRPWVQPTAFPSEGRDGVAAASRRRVSLRPACGIFRPQGVTFRSRGQALEECAAHGKQQY